MKRSPILIILLSALAMAPAAGEAPPKGGPPARPASDATSIPSTPHLPAHSPGDSADAGPPEEPNMDQVTSHEAAQDIAFGLVFERNVDRGRVAVTHGALRSVSAVGGRAKNGEFGDVSCIEVSVEDARVGQGAFATRVSVEADGKTFTFFLRDLTSGGQPMLVPDLGVAVVPAGDPRTYEQVEAALRERGLTAQWRRIEMEPEETFESASRGTRDEMCPTRLGLSRDLRLFRLSYDRRFGSLGDIEPALHGSLSGEACDFIVGRAASAEVNIVRRLEEGTLPILHAVQRDGTVEYHLTVFATLETRTLSPESLRGSHWLAAYANTIGHMLT